MKKYFFPDRGASGGHVGERIKKKKKFNPLEAELWPFFMSIPFMEAKRAFLKKKLVLTEIDAIEFQCLNLAKKL